MQAVNKKPLGGENQMNADERQPKRQMNGSFRFGSASRGYLRAIEFELLRDSRMIVRIAFATLLTAAAAGSAFALIPAGQVTAIADTARETVIAKTETWSLVSPLTVAECIDDECTMTVSN
jgi:hypothetical protein